MLCEFVEIKKNIWILFALKIYWSENIVFRKIQKNEFSKNLKKNVKKKNPKNISIYYFSATNSFVFFTHEEKKKHKTISKCYKNHIVIIKRYWRRKTNQEESKLYTFFLNPFDHLLVLLINKCSIFGTSIDMYKISPN